MQPDTDHIENPNPQACVIEIPSLTIRPQHHLPKTAIPKQFSKRNSLIQRFQYKAPLPGSIKPLLCPASPIYPVITNRTDNFYSPFQHLWNRYKINTKRQQYYSPSALNRKRYFNKVPNLFNLRCKAYLPNKISSLLTTNFTTVNRSSRIPSFLDINTGEAMCHNGTH